MTAQVGTAFTGKDELTPVVRRIDDHLGRLMNRFESLRGRFGLGFVTRAGERAYDLLERTFLRLLRIIPDLTNRGAQWMHIVDQLGDISGMTAAQASELASVAENVGVSSEGMGRAMNAMARSVSRTPEIFERFGIATRDVNGNLLDSYSIFQNARTRLASMEDGIKRADLAQRIFGRGSLEMMDLVTLSTSAYRKQADEARRSGLIVTNAGLAAAEELERVRGRFQQAITGVGTQVLVGVAPALNALVTGITRTIQANMANIVRFVAGVVNFIAGAVGQFTGLDLRPVAEGARSTVKSFSEWKRDMGLLPTTNEKAKASIDRVSSALDRQIAAIDRQLKAMDKADRSADARRQYQDALAQVAEARRELEDIRGETILASRMSEADAVLARQDRAARMAQASKRVREAEEQAEEVARRNRQSARREALQAERDRLMERRGGGGAGGGAGGVVGAVTGNLREQYRAYVRSMRAGTKDLQTSLVEGLDDVATDAQKAGARVADAIQDAIFGPDTKITARGGQMQVTVRQGGLIDVLRNVGDGLGKLAGLFPSNTDALLAVAAAIGVWKAGQFIDRLIPGAAAGAGAGIGLGAGGSLAAGLLASEGFKGLIKGIVPSTPNSRRISGAHPFGQSFFGGEGPDALVAGWIEQFLPGWLLGTDKGKPSASMGPWYGMLAKSGLTGAGKGIWGPVPAPSPSRGTIPGPGEMPGGGIADPLIWLRLGLRPYLGPTSDAVRAMQAAKDAGEAAAAAGGRTADNTDPIGRGRIGIDGIERKVKVKSDRGDVKVTVDASGAVRGVERSTHRANQDLVNLLERSSMARNLVRIAGDTGAFRKRGMGMYFVKPPGNKGPSSSTKP